MGVQTMWLRDLCRKQPSMVACNSPKGKKSVPDLTHFVSPTEAGERAPPSERPRLNLQKRTKPIDDDSSKTEKTASIFGNAKPVDTAAREREIEDRLQRERTLDQQELAEKDNRERRYNVGQSWPILFIPFTANIKC